MVVVKENPIDPTLTKNRLYAMIVQNAGDQFILSAYLKRS